MLSLILKKKHTVTTRTTINLTTILTNLLSLISQNQALQSIYVYKLQGLTLADFLA